MVAGTIAGDLSTLSDTPRNTTAVAERECVLWKLSRDELGRMEREDPRLAMKLVQVVLKGEPHSVSVGTPIPFSCGRGARCLGELHSASINIMTER